MAAPHKPKKLTRPRTTVTLYQGDYETQLADLADRHEAAERKDRFSPARFGTPDTASTLAKEYNELKAEAEKTAVRITLEAMPRRGWQALVADHPAREGNEDDARVGVNLEDFLDVVVQPCVVDPKFTDDEWDEFADSCSKAQWDKLSGAAWTLNVRGVDLPKSLLASRTPQGSDGD